MKKFSRTTEDFTCEHCGAKVHCLYSKHVDVNPGDRAAECGGLMEPADLEYKDGRYIIVHRCVKCGFVRKNKVVDGDDFDAVLELSRQKTERLKF